jgi:small multidrug resistance pump
MRTFNINIRCIFCTAKPQYYGALKAWRQNLNNYLLLLAAITLEVVGTLLLPASQGFNKLFPSVLVIGSYAASFYFLAIVVQQLPLAIVYASWAGLGVFSVALLSAVFYQQALNPPTVLGLFLIVIGVTLVNTFKIS